MHIFKGITATISQLSAKDVKKLWTIFEMYGGKLKPTLDATCTHLICGKGVGVSNTTYENPNFPKDTIYLSFYRQSMKELASKVQLLLSLLTGFYSV